MLPRSPSCGTSIILRHPIAHVGSGMTSGNPMTNSIFPNLVLSPSQLGRRQGQCATPLWGVCLWYAWILPRGVHTKSDATQRWAQPDGHMMGTMNTSTGHRHRDQPGALGHGAQPPPSGYSAVHLSQCHAPQEAPYMAWEALAPGP